MEISPLRGVLGAQVDEVELSPTMLDDLVEELHQALCEHEVLVVPGQDLSPAEQAGFSHLRGDYSPMPFVQPVPEHPEVIKVVKEATEPEAFNSGGVWHSDFSFLDAPPAFTILRALDLLAVGGGCETSSRASRVCTRPAPRSRRRSRISTRGCQAWTSGPRSQPRPPGIALCCARTPRPAGTACNSTGPTVRGLWGPGIGNGSDEGTRDEQRLLRWLHEFSTHVRFTLRRRWSDSDVVLWDNRSTQHVALNDYPGQRREFHRTTVAGPEPAR